jgi:hypothetical protein
MELGCTLGISFPVLLKIMVVEFWKYWSKNSLQMGSVYLKFWPSEFKYRRLARRQFIRNLYETNGCEHSVVGNLAFLQVSSCGISTGSIIGIC